MNTRLRRGFTLIELLVVISIIALLIAILLPTLQSARDTARAIQCASNMRQQGIMVAVYANNHKDYGPVAGNSGEGAEYNTPDTAMLPSTDAWWRQGYASRLNEENFPQKYALATDFVSMATQFNEGVFNMFNCPSNEEAFSTDPASIKRSYSPNANVLGRVLSAGNTNNIIRHRLDEVLEASRSFLVIEQWRNGFVGSSSSDHKGNASWGDTNFPAHGDSRNYLYVDGHAEAHIVDPEIEDPSGLFDRWYVRQWQND